MFNMKKSLKSLLVLALFAMLLVGCSSKKEEDKAVDNGNAEKSITITGVNGEVTLDKPAKKVVVLEWTYAEDLLAVGVQPAGWRI